MSPPATCMQRERGKLHWPTKFSFHFLSLYSPSAFILQAEIVVVKEYGYSGLPNGTAYEQVELMYTIQDPSQIRL